MSRELVFSPFPLFPGAHQQTIIGTFNFFRKKPASETQYLQLSDGDKIALEVTIPDEWKVNSPTLLLVHGLCGSHESPYMIRMAKKFSDNGFKVVRMNLRGCGSGRGHAKKIYHAGCTDDVLEVLKALKKEHLESDITLMGFSLGGNIVLKLAGELNTSASSLLKEVVGVAAPVDLFQSVNLIKNNTNRFYENYFLGLLRSDIRHRHEKFNDLGDFELPKNLTFYDFDECYTAPQCGYESAMDYYKRCSAVETILEVDIPCRVLFSEDDPIVSSTSLDHLSMPDHIEVYKTKKGGHLGFLGIPNSIRGFHWMDSVLLEWLVETKG